MCAMNIFAIESHSDGTIDWEKSALSHDNMRVNKMIIESCQMLSTNAQIYGEETRYKKSFMNHPSTIWARESSANFRNLTFLARCLHDEFCRRYNKVSHGSKDVIDQMYSLCHSRTFNSKFPTNTETPLPLCMPDEYKSNDVVESYRNFFANKPNLSYIRGTIPAWVHGYRSINLKSIKVVDAKS